MIAAQESSSVMAPAPCPQGMAERAGSTSPVSGKTAEKTPALIETPSWSGNGWISSGRLSQSST